MTTLSLEASRKIFELIGKYETERRWIYTGKWKVVKPRVYDTEKTIHSSEGFPAPTFSELIRVLPRIGEKKGWEPIKQVSDIARWMLFTFMTTHSEPQAMRDIETYLEKIL